MYKKNPNLLNRPPFNNSPNGPALQKITPRPRFKSVQSKPRHQLSTEDKKRKGIADENKKFVLEHPNLISTNIETVKKEDYEYCKSHLPQNPQKPGTIYINNNSSIWTAIDCHHRRYNHIYVLNFADALKPGGGYLNGRGAQEETLCRQTLLYPTLQPFNFMYTTNAKKGPEASDVMILSHDVLVIRDDEYELLDDDDRFYIDVISSPAVNNSQHVQDAAQIMLRRIRKIVTLAAHHAKPGEKVALILGAFGCGVFKNDAEEVAKAFATVLNKEKMRKYFDCVVFPIFKDKSGMTQKFRRHLWG